MDVKHCHSHTSHTHPGYHSLPTSRWLLIFVRDCPSIVPAPQKRRVDHLTLLRLTRLPLLWIKMRPWTLQLIFDGVKPSALKERDAISIILSRRQQYAMRCSFADAICDDFEFLAHVNDECARDCGDVNPLTRFV
jgi:hypothetical protein